MPLCGLGLALIGTVTRSEPRTGAEGPTQAQQQFQEQEALHEDEHEFECSFHIHFLIFLNLVSRLGSR